MRTLSLYKGVLLVAVPILLLIVPTVVFGVNCIKNPTHRNCPSDPPDDPPPPDDEVPGETGDFIFHVDIEGVFIGDQDSRLQTVTTGTKSVIFSPRQGFPMEFTLGPFWTNRTYQGGASGETCFGDLGVINGSLHLNESEGSQIGIAAFWFRAGDDNPDTDTEIKYVIEFHDDFDWGWDDGDPETDTSQFPPGSDPLVLHPSSWELRTEGKGELKKGPCIGRGDFGPEAEGKPFVQFSLYRK